MIERSPDKWVQHMRLGDFEAAWEVSDGVLQANRRRTYEPLPRHLQRIWDGTPLEGKRVLVRCYHGLGDTIQFIRFMPLLKSIAAEVIVWVQPSLLRLLQNMKGFDVLIPLHDGTPHCEYDVDVEIMELPHVFRTTLQTIPAEVPYLYVSPAIIPADSRPAVGLFWKAGDWDPHREVPFRLMEGLNRVPSISLCILERDARWAHDASGVHVLCVPDDIFETARVIAALDLVISVDSMPAHLAGALGVPTWTLLHSDADWRWLQHRGDSPWYPTMRLFRQHEPVFWEPVIDRVAAELQTWAGGHVRTKRHK
jgi:glycosyl transferase family 9 (putative heptosyltransferase)